MHFFFFFRDIELKGRLCVGQMPQLKCDGFVAQHKRIDAFILFN
jgi:hypothetical protein